jgi:hypothetical protein
MAALDAELERLREFLAVKPVARGPSAEPR